MGVGVLRYALREGEVERGRMGVVMGLLEFLRTLKGLLKVLRTLKAVRMR